MKLSIRLMMRTLRNKMDSKNFSDVINEAYQSTFKTILWVYYCHEIPFYEFNLLYKKYFSNS